MTPYTQMLVLLVAAGVFMGCAADTGEPAAGVTGTGGAAGAGGTSGIAGAAGWVAMDGGSGTAGNPGTGGMSADSGSGGAFADSGSGGVGGIASDAAVDAAPPKPVTVVLVNKPGAVFVPTATTTLLKVPFGAKGVTYLSVRVELDVTVGDYQPEVPDEGNPDRTDHILFGLFRANQTKSDQRYLMGSGAVTFANKQPHFRMYGRVSIGPGYPTYKQWSATYVWQKTKTYHLDCLLDGVSHKQSCHLSLNGAVVKSHSAAVLYLDPASHLNSGFYIELGRGPADEIETSPLGWQFSNLLVTVTKYP